MEKIKTSKNILDQLKHYNGTQEKQIDAMQLYCNFNYFDINKIDFTSYYTKIATYNKKNNILYITNKKYSITTTRQQNKIINNFIKYNNTKIVYTNKL